jgi:HSP20 family molecular chaperone IbpA
MKSMYLFDNVFGKALEDIFYDSYYDCCKVKTKFLEYQDGDKLILEYVCPGHQKEDIDISYEGDTLSLKVNSSKKKEEKGYRPEKIEESFRLENYDVSKTEVSYKEGILKLILHKKEEKKLKKMKIEF